MAPQVLDAPPPPPPAQSVDNAYPDSLDNNAEEASGNTLCAADG